MTHEADLDPDNPDIERERRAETWIERAARRLEESAAMEAEIDSLTPSPADDGREESTQPKISELDQEFMTALRDNWWRVYPALASLEYELEMLMNDAPDRSGDFLFDRQFGALQTAWLIGRENSVQQDPRI